MRTIYRVKDNFGTTVFRTTDPNTAGAYAAASNGENTVTHTLTKFEIELLKARGLTRQSAQSYAIGIAGVFGVAYFGHYGTAEDKRIIRALNKKIDQVFN